MSSGRRKRFTVEREKAAGWWGVEGPDGCDWVRTIDRGPAEHWARRLNDAYRLGVTVERARARRAARSRARQGRKGKGGKRP